jgi:outer membrane protein TolC
MGILVPPAIAISLVLGCASRRERDAFAELDKAAQARPSNMADTWEAAGGEAPDTSRSLPELSEESELSAYLAYAALNNPGLEAAFNRWKAALWRIPQARSLPDPKFTYRYFIEEVETRVGPQRQAFSLAQTFPWLKKLELRGDVALAEAHAARQRYEAEKLKLFYEVRDAYDEYYYLARAIEVVRENRDLIKYLEGVARTKYKAAAGGHPEVIRAQVELGKLDDQLRALEDLRGAAAARLNAAMNRPIQAELPWPKELAEEHIEITDEQVLAWFRQHSPELKALEYEIARERSAVRLAGQDYFPDFTLGVDYTDVGTGPRQPGQGLGAPFAQRSAQRLAMGMGDGLDVYNIARSFRRNARPGDAGQDVWAVWLSMTVPIWYGKYGAAEREARARLAAAMHTKVQRANVLGAQIKMVLYNLRDAERKIDLYRDTLIPKAKQSLGATETSYRAGGADFLDIIDAQRVLLEFQLSYERALADLAGRLAEVEMLVGRPLPRRAQQEPGRETSQTEAG